MIVPAILVPTFEQFAEQVKRLEGLFSYAQIDVMDGKFVANKSFGDIEKINGLQTGLKFEAHLMVEHPLEEIEKWAEIKNVFRIIFHIESKDDPLECLNNLRGKCLQAGIALNPETPLDAIKKYYKLADVVMFMTVHPGKQGAKFLPEVKEKVVEFNKWEGRPQIAVDGGINSSNIADVKNWGVKIFNVGGALTMAEDVSEACKELQKKLIN